MNQKEERATSRPGKGTLEPRVRKGPSWRREGVEKLKRRKRRASRKLLVTALAYLS